MKSERHPGEAAAPTHEKYDPGRTAVLVIDVQNDFVSPGGGLDRLGVDLTSLRAMVERTVRFLADARRIGVRIVYVTHVNSDEASSPPLREKRGEQGRDSIRVVWKGTWGAELAPELDVRRDEDLVVDKTRFDAFLGTDLDERLRALGIRTVVVTGMSTNVCVDCTARAAFMRDYYVVVPEDCVASSVPRLHPAALETLGRYFATVTTSEAVLRAWQQADATRSSGRLTGRNE